VDVPLFLYRSCRRWLLTQEDHGPVPGTAANPGSGAEGGWLIAEPILFRRRAPGNTCLSALRSKTMGTLEAPMNNSKGCGGIMRITPIPLLFRGDRYPAEYVYRSSCAAAALTHGHPSGYISAGCLALILHFILHGRSLRQAASEALDFILLEPGSEETADALRCGIDLADRKTLTPEALGISLACALRFHDDFRAGVLTAVNHSGDSDSTGSITGNILGLLLGKQAIPREWVDNLEGASIVEEMAEDLFTGFRGDPDSPDAEWLRRYPCDET